MLFVLQFCALCVLGVSTAASALTLEVADVFELEWASDPQIAPGGDRIVYVRNFMDRMSDRRRASLWMIDSDGSNHRPLATGSGDFTSPRFSPDGKRLAYVGNDGDVSQLFVRWLDTGQVAQLTRLRHPPRNLAWAGAGDQIAFTKFVPLKSKPLAQLPPKPLGAEWAAPPTVIDRLVYRADGRGYLRYGYRHLFVVPAAGGTARQLTFGAYNHDGTPVWLPRDEALVIAGNRHDDWERDPLNTELYEVNLKSGRVRALTSRQGPDQSPALAPDGNQIAYVGFDDRVQGYQVANLYLLDRSTGRSRPLTEGFDRSIDRPVWDERGRRIYVRYDERGASVVARASLQGEVEPLVRDLGGTALARPYPGGAFSVADNGTVAYVSSHVNRPADVTVLRRGRRMRLTGLNEDLLNHREMPVLEELQWRSSADDRLIQGWLLKPPGFDPAQRYPLLLEIHGGPYQNYGDRFAMELQLYAAAGYVVLYANPRGSTSYGEAFAGLIHHNYPGQDYDDLMSGIDAVLTRGYVDPDRLFVTGGSGGGVLTGWIVGKTDRFKAAAMQKPVINWTSFVLTADNANFFYRYWFPDYPWRTPEHYFKRSPLSLVGNVRTPTMLITGESDYRTPISESEQYYQALKLRDVDSVLVRLPGATHNIAARPSQLAAKVAYILAWFERFSGAGQR